MIQPNVALAKLTSWHIGGSAQWYIRPQSMTELQKIVKEAKQPVTWLGLGSNVLIRDAGIKGLVIGTRALNQIYDVGINQIFCEVGVTSAKLARMTQQCHLSGGEFFAGIPGTIGGALAMNAGAFGGETWRVVKNVTVINQSGELSTYLPHDFEIGYRKIKPLFNDFLGFVGATFEFKSSQAPLESHHIRDLLNKRKATQPIGTLNCGSVFRNPYPEYAAGLIEAAGLKGCQIGNAKVSEKHANFIINLGQATAYDVEQLMSKIQKTVHLKFNIWLEPEVKILGYF